MTQLSLFDYSSLDPETRIVVQQKTGEIRDRIKRSAQDMIEIGERLIDIKSRLGHGRFSGWLGAEFDWSERTAERLIGVAEAFKSDKLSDLTISPSALYALSAPSVPQPARDEAIELASNGHPVTHADAQEIRARFSPRSATVPREEATAIPEARNFVRPSLPLTNFGDGPTFPPGDAPKSTEGWLANTSKLNSILLFVREQGDISGSVFGWTPDQVSRLEVHLCRFKEQLDRWIEQLRNNP